MGAHAPRSSRQTGYMLLEALVSMVVFSVGILGLVAMQATSIQSNSAARYRADASVLANELFARMWADDRTPASLQARYQTGGAGYTTWLADVQARLPGVTSTANVPTVTADIVPGFNPPGTSKTLVTINISWQLPGETASHSYKATSEIK